MTRRPENPGDHVGWFETLYAFANHNPDAVPWAYQAANPHLRKWLEQESVEGRGRRAVVVGCGLGDDAEELARRGFTVTAFDVSPSAVAWCKERFPDSPVHYVVADLFAPPEAWVGAFDFVLEIRTIQSLPLAARERCIAAVAVLAAPDGLVLVMCNGREDAVEPAGPPWPVSRAELKTFERQGLALMRFEDWIDPEITRNRTFRVVYHRPV